VIKVEKIPEKNRVILHIFKLKISFKDNLRYYLLSPLVQILKLFSNIYFFVRRLTIKKNYKIISLGTYCFSRVITTSNKLKPRRCKGEKTCPFDLAFFYNLDKVATLIETKFEKFYDDLILDNKGQWVNPEYEAVFNHEINFTREEFISRYNCRITNLYNYIQNKMFHKIFVIASFEKIEVEQFENLKRVLSQYIPKDKFSIIYINQSNENPNYNCENVYVINQNREKFDLINLNGGWVEEIKSRNSLEAVQIYYDLTTKMLDIIKKVMSTN